MSLKAWRKRPVSRFLIRILDRIYRFVQIILNFFRELQVKLVLGYGAWSTNRQHDSCYHDGPLQKIL